MKPSSVFLSVTGSMIVASRLYAQAPPARTNWEFTAAKGSTLTTASVGIVASTPVLLKHARFGIGVRGTFATGDLKLTPAGAKNVPAGVVDTLHASARALMFNISGHVSALVTRRLEAGMNIDLVGLGTGGSRESRYRASAAATPVTVDASPATTNVFLYGSKDRGSLNSEFFVAWRATDRLTIRGGLSHQLVEYKATRVLTSNTDRFRQYSNLAVIGLRVAR